MKNFILIISLLFLSAVSNAQNGLEGVIVETYYVSEPNDTNANVVGGVLPVGSVTYRIYLDLLPGYKFQVCYGIIDHPLQIKTSTLFFNNEDRGSTEPNFSFTNAAKNTVMLDSWISAGAACNGYFGVLKTEDNGVNNINNNFSPQVLQGQNPAAGIPLTVQDGLIAGTPEAVTVLGLDGVDTTLENIAMFDNVNDGTNGPEFYTLDGSWSALNGTYGPDTISNKVLIGQFTTDGQFCFKLNVQIRTPQQGIVQNFVAENPTILDILDSTLSFCSSGVGFADAVNSNPPAFSIYRNPTPDFLSMWVYASRRNADYTYNVYSAEGQLMFSKYLGHLQSDVMEKIDLSELSSGMYLVELVADGSSASKRVVKF